MQIPQILRRWLSLLVTVLSAILLGGCNPAKLVTIRGQIVDDDTGQPVADATICFQSAFGNVGVESDYRAVTCDAHGSFEFRRVRVKDALTSTVRLCAMKRGYDWTNVSLGNSTGYEAPLEIRLEPDRNVRLPQGILRIEHARFQTADEPTFRFVFKEDQLQFASDDEQTDFQLHFRFQPENDRTDRMLGSFHSSKSGRSQFLASVTTTGGIGQLTCERTIGHPPRLPDLAAVGLSDSFSFDRPYDSWFRRKNEFLLKTHDGRFALLHFSGDAWIDWVYQPDGSLDIDRRRKNAPAWGTAGNARSSAIEHQAILSG